ncbi:hypothetical protein BD560DRAFT_450194 [Blakeslea trispora]|nr:hypothetical protein BD560DRAFT_450194 [Blakeslea trispora]
MNRQIPTVAASTPRAPVRPSVRSVSAARTEERFEEVFYNLDVVSGRLARMESLLIQTDTSTSANRVTINARNPTFLKAVKDSFDDAKQVGVEFDYRQPMKTSSRNRSVFDGIHQHAIAKVKALSGFSGDQELSYEVQRCLGEKVRNQFDLIRRRQKRDASLPEARTTFQVSERKRKRLQRKLRYRTACFANNKAMMTSLFGEDEECTAVLDMKYMSEEEDVEENVEEDSCFRVLVPSWRSDKLNQFLAALDSIHKKKNKTIRASRRREVVEKKLPTGRHEKFPQWAIRS